MRFLFLPAEDDPDSYVRKHGQEAFEKLARDALTLSGFLLGELRGEADLATAEGRSKFLTEAKPHLQKITAPGLRLQLVKEVAALAKVSQDEAEALLEMRPAGERAYRRPAPARVAAPLITSQEQNLLRCVLAKPSLAAALDLDLLDERLAETAALRTVAGWLEVEEAPSEAMLIERMQGSEHEAVVFRAQAAMLEHGPNEESAEPEFRQIQLSLNIKRKNEEIESLKRDAANQPELGAELARRTKELAALKSQRM
jgi:DNA primase